MTALDPSVLDDVPALEAGDPDGMLPATASAGAQVREAVTLADEAGLAALADGGRPRAVVVTGMGGSAAAGEVLAAVALPRSPAPVVVSRGHVLPAWVGAPDLVVAISCSGSTEETLAATDDAIRRGCRLLAVGAAGSPLAERAEQARAPLVPVPQGRMPRASLWALAVPLLVAARELGLLSLPPALLADTADLLDDVAARCRPGSDAFVNPAKALAVELVGALPMVWGSSSLAGVAAARFVTQLAENAKLPAVAGVLPEATHNQVVALDGLFGAQVAAGAGAGPADPADPAGVDDFFRDRGDDDEADGARRLRLVLLRDAEELPQVTRRVDAARDLAAARGVPVSELSVAGAGIDRPGVGELQRLAGLVGLVDFASVYLALLQGTDPTPIAAIDELKAAMAGGSPAGARTGSPE